MKTLQLAYPLLCISNLYLHLKFLNQDAINETIDESLSKIMMMMKTNFVSESTERKIEKYFQQETSNEELCDKGTKIDAEEKEFERNEQHEEEEEESGLNRYGYDVETSLLDEQIQSIGKHSERKVAANVKSKNRKRNKIFGFFFDGSSANKNSHTNMPSSSVPSDFPVASVIPSTEYSSQPSKVPSFSLSPSSFTPLVPSSSNGDYSSSTGNSVTETEEVYTRSNPPPSNGTNNNFIIQSIFQMVTSIMDSFVDGFNLPSLNPVTETLPETVNEALPETLPEILPDTDEPDLPNVETVTEILPDTDNLDLPDVETITEILPDTDSLDLLDVETVAEILPDTDSLDLLDVETVAEILPDTDEPDLPDIGSNNNPIVQGLQQIITFIMGALFNNDEDEFEPSASPSYQSVTSVDIDSSSDDAGSNDFIDDFFLDDDSSKGQDSSMGEDSSLPVSSSGYDELLTSNGSLDQPPVSDYKIWLDGLSWDGNNWLDKSTNGHQCDIHGTINTAVDVDSGMAYLYGGTTSGVTLTSGWASGSEYTFFHITKYNGPTKRRIWSGTTGNWLSGHRTAQRGTFYHGGWITNEINIGNVDSWGIFTDRVNSSGSNVRVDGVDETIYPTPKYIPGGIGINIYHEDADLNSKKSDWAAGLVLVYERYLSDNEVESVEDWINIKYTAMSCIEPCEPIAQVDFSQGDKCSSATCSLHGGAEIKTAPGGTQALRIDSNGAYAKIPGIDISPSKMPGCTLAIGLYLESKPEGAKGWIFGHDNGGKDRTIVLHDPEYSENNDRNVIASGTGEIWSPWDYDNNLVTGTAPTKEWFHVTAVFRQGGECAVYVNGVKSDYTTTGKNNEGLPDLYVGRPGTFVGDNNLWANAWIKEVKVFDGALSDAQVQWESVKFFGSLDQPPVSDYKIWLDGQSWDGNNWLDKSINGHHCETHDTINTAVDVDSGMTYLYGGMFSGVTLTSGWASGSEYTFFHVTKYNGPIKERIWSGTTKNWKSGHWKGKRGMFYHGGWNTQTAESVGDADSWGIFTDRVNSGASNVRVDGVDVTTNPDPNDIPDGIGINPAIAEWKKPSDWAAGMVLVYERYLSDNDVESVEAWINTTYRLPPPTREPSIPPTLMPSNLITVPFAQVDFSHEGGNCPTCTPYYLEDGAEIKTAPGRIQALRIDSEGPYAIIPGVDISPSKMPDCTLTIGVYLESIPEGAKGWIFGHDNGGRDRTIVLHDPQYSENNEQNVIASGTGGTWIPWNDGNLETGTAPTKEWFHATAVFRQGGNCYVYVNGVKSDKMTTGNNDNDYYPDLYVGRPGTFWDDYWANAWIKEVKVFDIALADAQVQYESDTFFGITRTDTIGGSGGIPFDDKHAPWKYGMIKEIEMYVDPLVKSIRITYANGRSFGHGTEYYGQRKTITLDEHEYIVGISARSDDNGIHEITFEKNDGSKHGPFGKEIGQLSGIEFGGNALLHIFGRSDDNKVYQLGFAHISSSSLPSSMPSLMPSLSPSSKPSLQLSSQPSSRPSNLITVPFAQVDFSHEGGNCPTCTPYYLEGGAEIKTAPGGIQALRIDSDGSYAIIPGIDISPSKMPDCTLTIGVYLESISDGAKGWIFGHDNGGRDRTIVLHDPQYSKNNDKNVIASGTGEIWYPWDDDNLETGTTPTKEWFHVTAVFRQDGDCYVYVNGAKSDKMTTGNNDDDNYLDLYVGQPDVSDHVDSWSDAWIKEVKVFDIALADAQVQYESDTFFGITRTDTVGGSGGIPFDDKHAPWKYGVIEEIEIYIDTYVKSIRITYDNGRSFLHGTEYGQKETITLDDHEYIVGVSVRSDDNGVHDIIFEKNDGTKRGPFGSNIEGNEFLEIGFEGNALLHIFGLTKSEGGELFQLGFAHISSSSLPSSMPSLMPSVIPSSQPSERPTLQPSNQPSSIPTQSPTSIPSLMPSVIPSSQPSLVPSVQPSNQPSSTPTQSPSLMPSLMPSVIPSSQPSERPSIQPSNQPSSTPTQSPSSMPSLMPSVIPSSQPSLVPSAQPSNQPSSTPTQSPSSIPSLMPSVIPSTYPSEIPSIQPSNQPSSTPTESPSSMPSLMPSVIPSSQPSSVPSVQPSVIPSTYPSEIPSIQPSNQPSSTPTESPSSIPSLMLSVIPSTYPSVQPTVGPSKIPTVSPSGIPSSSPSDQNSKIPSVFPTIFPSKALSYSPSIYPTVIPSSQPSKIPSIHPSIIPTHQPSALPSKSPSIYPTVLPSDQPSGSPSMYPSVFPSDQPSKNPSIYPSIFPSDQPSKSPSIFPSVSPSYQPSNSPSVYPSAFPSDQPTDTPSIFPSVFPSIFPSVGPSNNPSVFPSIIPSFQPTPKPTVYVDISQAPSDESQKIPDFETTCVLMKTEVSICEDDPDFSCSIFALQGYCNHIDYYQNMTERCQKSCDRCPPPQSSDFSHEKMQQNSKDFVAEFNLNMTINTDANSQETSWIFLSESPKVTIVRSNESDATSELFDNTLHELEFSCRVSYIGKKEMNPNTTEPLCYTLEVHDSDGDGMCCDNGSGSFGISINNTKNETLTIANPFYDGSKMELSFCIDNDGKIESETDTSNVKINQPTYFPLRRMQCKKRTSCHCDSKPNLFTDVKNDDVLYDTKDQTLLAISTLSQPKQLQDVESPQYKAACWVLFDDPYQYVSKEMNTGTKRRKLQQYVVTPDLFIEEGTQKRMMQRYAMAVLYFSTEPQKWKKHLQFLSSRSECEWRSKESNGNRITSIQGPLCDTDGNIISLYLTNNNLNGTITEELSELKSLEVLDLSTNNIQGSIPSVLGQLSKLRELHLSQNALEGAIHPHIFNADNLEKIELDENKISDTIPDTIENLRRLSSLNLNLNDLSGSIPDAMYSLKSLQNLNLGSNQFSSSISPLVGNLKKLKTLHLSGNSLSGQIPSRVGELKELQELILGNNTLSGSIPSTVGELSSLSKLALDENQLTGKIPESLFNLPSLRGLKLQSNAVMGSIPDQLCEIDGLDLQADCQNDIFEPQVSCSCCNVCSDKTPIWDGECADATIKIEIDRRPIEHEEYSFSSDGLEWSLVNAASKKKIPLKVRDGMSGGSACVAFSDCISIDMVSQPIFDTYFQIYWNNVQVEDGIRKFPGSLELGSTYEYKNKPFQYDEENQELITCRKTELLTCHDGSKEKKLIFDPKSPMHISFSKVTSLFGRQNTLDSSSHKSKALCWVLQTEDSNDELKLSDIEISERFILTILHLKSQNGLFSKTEYPPESHECEWPGIQCVQNNNTRVVSRIFLSSEHNQIINGTLIEEIGGLQYLEILEFNQTQLEGTIPKSLSNLWSLKKLNLSGNRINGTLPSTLFQQLNNLEHIDLSDNKMSGHINDDIGSVSSIRSLDLSRNQFTGSFPLDGFKYNDLEYLDVSGNKLNSVEFHHLIKHTKLKSLDLSFNFFVGSLNENTFTSLAELEYLNISQNDFSGTIPSTFPELSNITHFDMHENRFKGVIPVGITDLSYIQYINLQGNQLTGSLPSQINQLKNLETLVLSHNEIKGTIPFDPNTLQNMDELHLHGNSLVGKAPQFTNMSSYITDCGFPSASLKPISCPTCNTCCNSDGNCQEKSTKKLSQVDLTVIFLCSIVGFLSICYMMKYYITHNKYLDTYFCETVGLWNPMKLISDKSVYHFLLARNKILWLIAVVCVVFQGATLFLFVQSADLANEASDREYTMTCPANSLDCEDSNQVSSYGKFVFGLILTIWLMKDIISSVKLMLISFQHKNIDFFFAGASVFTVTMLSLWSSIFYIIAIAVKNTDLIKDAVVLLFVIEIDERIYILVEHLNPEWVNDIGKDMMDIFVYLRNDLVIGSTVTDVYISMKIARKKIRENIQRVIRTLFRRRRRNSYGDVAVSSEAVDAAAPEFRP